ncbi:MAG: XTP/dITP diphosphatase [Candidatus Baldrarchaeia archaeon]
MLKNAKDKDKRKLHVATGNKHKFMELREILSRFGINVEWLKSKIIEIQADDLETIASFSARVAANEYGVPVIVEDAGLFIEELKGFPGPYSSYVFKTIGNEGILKLLKGVKNRRAYFKSVIAYCEPGNNPITFDGYVYGVISEEIRGSHGFGYDPIFCPEEGDGRTFGEMILHEKNKLSHRARAAEKFARWFLGIK